MNQRHRTQSKAKEMKCTQKRNDINTLMRQQVYKSEKKPYNDNWLKQNLSMRTPENVCVKKCYIWGWCLCSLL